jgi:medium-chain acyl-[acyl-carrier-protein] hydrolase
VTSDNAWVHYAVPRPDAAVRLFCFPYAGAGTHAFREFARELPERIEVAALRLPGRCAGAGEPAVTRIDSVVERLAEAVVPHLTKPSVFFGHSMGAHLAFELARHLAGTGRPGPDRLLVSGCPAPHEKQAGEPGQALPEEMFTRAEGSELREVALDSLRADLTLAQSYEYLPGPPLNVPIHAFHGHEDPIAGGPQMAEWVTHTNRYFTILGLAGDHFFIHSRRSQLLAGIAAAIG